MMTTGRPGAAGRMPCRLLALWLGLGLLALPAARANVQPDESSGVVGNLVAKILRRSHYMRREIDDEVGRQTLKSYLEYFDYNHQIFERSDIENFEKLYADNIDDRLRRGDVSPAYQIFNIFLGRLKERVAHIEELVSQKHDFTLDEEIRLDRHELPWPATTEDLREYWRLKIKHELLEERLAKLKADEEKAKAEKNVKKKEKKKKSAEKEKIGKREKKAREAAKNAEQGPEEDDEDGATSEIVKRYKRHLRSYGEFDRDDVLQAYLSSLAHTFDPHSDYMSPPSLDNFNIGMRLSLVGIGAVLRPEDGYAKIVSLVPGGPADKDKRIKPNDRIEAVAQGDEPFLEVVGMKLDRLVQLIRGEKGTVVRLRMIPADAMDPSTRVAVSIVRDNIQLRDQEAKARIYDGTPDGRKARIGVIDLPSFYADMRSHAGGKSTTRDVAKLIEGMTREGIDGLILDLRRNGGGSLSESISLTGLFIPDGPVVQVKDARGSIKPLADDDPTVSYTGPLLVLTSRMSASASEILAGAIQDYGRGIILGENSTFGKGTVQQMLDLDPYMPMAFRKDRSGALKLTIQKFYRISGESTQNRGVIPDVILPALANHMDVTESAMDNAMPYDVDRPADYERIDIVAAALPDIKAKSAERIATDPEFEYIRGDIERYKIQKEKKTHSINEQKRLLERAEMEKRHEDRKKARKERGLKPLKFTELTLENAEKGVPSAVPDKPKKDEEAEKDEDEGDSVEEGYEKAPLRPDSGIYEGIQILADLIAKDTSRATADHSQNVKEQVIP